jgi:hypothetical protein
MISTQTQQRSVVNHYIIIIQILGIAIITPATIYVKAVIPAKAGIQNWTGCRIKSGMTFGMFNCRSNRMEVLSVTSLQVTFSHPIGFRIRDGAAPRTAGMDSGRTNGNELVPAPFDFCTQSRYESAVNNHGSLIEEPTPERKNHARKKRLPAPDVCRRG